MKKIVLLLFFIGLFGFLIACSNKEMAEEIKTEEANDSAIYSVKEEKSSLEVVEEDKPVDDSEVISETSTERMIIHKAIIKANVKELAKAQNNIEQKVKKYGGYIVSSDVYQEDDLSSSGNMIVRIPEHYFETFLSEAEGEASKVIERNVTGQDVTEQFVDLTSRIKSKRVVEERLLTFMENAEKTEDLLKISSDLANVQEEIEVLVGKVNYLENQTSFSTIEIALYEKRVIVPEIENKDLNTWEKTKKQFVTSTNVILTAGSGVIVFFIGNLPVLLILCVITFAVYWTIKRKRIEK
ncbi:DUF4349 domain-containing protein [Bacillus sp. Cr_A10]|uniref:DUF4349 domain-containing protein n=1 Tax=Bacillus sp. Cr_A10 TaxID=3033993 RepID=UPI0023D9ADED|nr:DUF4349 domain-containing protein [Bacillus sp. Cr_A10]MDF2067690.1 DUF4349 domain-containing protein [Bacillus sp. Cr_A10]